MKILVSACLLGRNCKYSGGNNYSAQVEEFLRGKDVMEVCPEVMAGLPVPRTPIEIVDGVLMDRSGKNVDSLLRQTAARAVAMAKAAGVNCAILQPRSPTCGARQVYDGTFSGRLVPGSGIFAQALRAAGITVVDAGSPDWFVELLTCGGDHEPEN